MNFEISTEPSDTKQASPHVKPKETKGKAMMERRQNAYRKQKNVQAAKDIRAEILARLQVQDPCDVENIPVESAVVPTAVPVSLAAIPRVIDQTWSRMESIGNNAFKRLNTPENKCIFYRTSLILFEAKVAYAQRTVETKPDCELVTARQFNDLQLVSICEAGSRLPSPLAVAIEALGHFRLDQQVITPVAAQNSEPILSGAVNFFYHDMRRLVQELANPHPVSTEIVTVSQILTSLPGIEWAETEDRQVFLTPQTVAFWGNEELLPANHVTVFRSVVSSMELKKGFLLYPNIQTGEGSAVPVVRFPNAFDTETDEVEYYTNSVVSPFEERLATALQYGLDYGTIKRSRFCTGYHDSLKRGSASQSAAIGALVWSY